MLDATFARPDLTTFCRLDGLGLEVVGQRLESTRAVLACRVTKPDRWCRRCGCEGVPRDSVTRTLAHEPFGWRPTTLLVTLSRYRCSGAPAAAGLGMGGGAAGMVRAVGPRPLREGAHSPRVLAMISSATLRGTSA